MSKKLFVGISAPNSVDLLIGQLRYFKERGYSVFLLAPKDQRVTDYVLKEGVGHIPVKIERKISFWKDLQTLFNLIWLFMRERPDIINLGTPKMSLLGMLAGFITRVPLRIYTCRGFRFEHETGSLRRLLIRLERITSICAHRIFCISKSVRDLGIELDIFPLEKTRLIEKGSSNGVDLSLFNPSHLNKCEIEALREKFGLQNRFVIGFVGRLVDRKGLKEMYDAFDEVYNENQNLRLLVVGRPFWDQIRDRSIIEELNDHPGIIMAGFQPIETIPYFISLMDIFFLPAHWEGFGNVLIQAAAMGVPILATNVTGCKDAVSDGYNGVLVPAGNMNELVAQLNKLILNNELRKTLGENGIAWSRHFKPEIIWQGYEKLYEEKV